MKIKISNKKLEKKLKDQDSIWKHYGKENGTLIIRRLEQLLTAENLSEIYKLSGPRLHPLIGGRKGQYAVDLKHPCRLTFEVEGGEKKFEKITSIVILEIKDYHKKKK